MAEMTFTEDEFDPFEEKFDFDCPEHVLFYYCGEGSLIEIHEIMSDNEEVTGAASYENSYGGFLDDVVWDMLEKPISKGFWVLMDVTGCYHKGDGWSTDDDMDFYCGELRKATDEETAGISFDVALDTNGNK